jgi:surfactin synthase thioesterase subunit
MQEGDPSPRLVRWRDMTRTSGAATTGIVRPQPRPDAARRLVCLSFCGGGTASFRPWASVLPPDVELDLVCYPGREGRYGAPFAQTWDELQDDVLRSVSVLTDRPYTLLGHSMGGWVAFDLAARLAASGLPGPSALVVSAAEAPARWATKRSRAPRPADTDESLLHWMSTVGQLAEPVLRHPELRAMAVEVLRADLRVSDGFRYYPGTRLDVPIQVLYGAEDVDVDADAVAGWPSATSGPTHVDRLPGGHFYTPEQWASLPNALREPSGVIVSMD